MPMSVNAKTKPLRRHRPDDTVFDFHLAGDVPQPVFVFAELLGDAGDIADNPLRAAAERFGAKLYALHSGRGTQIIPLKMRR